jgi:hypothetical protein
MSLTRLVLLKALSSASKVDLPISLINLDVWNLTESEVSRERITRNSKAKIWK